MADIYVHHNQLIAFGSAENNSKFTTIPHKLQITGLTNPGCVQINKDDQLIVEDKEAVKIFNRNYQLLHQFTPDRMTEPSIIMPCSG